MNMKGETLIEVLVALTIVVVIITAIAVLGVSSLGNSQFIENQGKSTKYAQEGMETIRSLRNSDYPGFASYTGTYCLPSGVATLNSSLTCTTPNIDNVYIRTVSIIQDGGCGTNLAKATVTVSWTDRKCGSGTFCHKSVLTSCLSTVSPIQGP